MGFLIYVNVYRDIFYFLDSSSQEDPFGDYASVDTEHALADERVFGVLKLTKLAAERGANGFAGAS